MKFYNKLSAFVLAAAMCVSGLGFTACDDDNDFGTEQYVGGVHLNVFGPSPVARGGELRFLGSGMSQITSIEIPGCDPITDIKVISNEEIRVMVPQTAMPGKVVLNYADGKITTLTMLSYTEPISLDSFSPNPVKPGQKLTIKGEYLNLIGEVIFADEVIVPKADFVSQSRSEIVLTVPEEAKTGKIIISDAAVGLPNWIYSDEELKIVLPSVESTLDLTNAKPGQKVTIEGQDLDLVRTMVLTAEGKEDLDIEFTYTEDGKIEFVLPDNTFDGAICVVPASGIKVAVANIGMVVPTEIVATPATDLRADMIVSLKGINMDQIVSVTFPNVADAVEPVSVTSSEITVKFPAMAQSGKALLNLKSGKTVEVELATAKPEVTGFDPAEAAAAAPITLVGKNLDLVVSVIFTGDVVVEVPEASAADRLTIDCPPTAQTGKLILTMANGETVETQSLTVNLPECAYITATVTENLLGGELMEVTVANGDKLTGVKVNGEAVQYILSGDRLFISLPKLASAGSVITLVSSNGSIDYTYDVTPATHVENVIWSGAWENSSWSGNQDLAWGGFDWTTIPAGAKLTFYFTPLVADGEWWCVSLRHGDGWGNIPALPAQYDTPEGGVLTVEFTQEVLDDIIAHNGLVISGSGYILTKIVAEWDIDLETTIWQGPLEITWGDGGRVMVPAAAFEGVKPGKQMRFYFAQKTDTWAQAQINDGSWAGIVFPEIKSNTFVPTNEEFFGWTFSDDRQFDVTLTAEILQQIAEKAGDCEDQTGCGIIIQGSDLIFNKITLLP